MAIKFTPNRSAVSQLMDGEQMRSTLQRVAEQGAEFVDQGAPSIVKHRGSRIYGSTEKEPAGWVGRVAVRSPFWHFPEYGHSRYAPRPFLRPGVQKLLSQYGGRFQSK